MKLAELLGFGRVRKPMRLPTSLMIRVIPKPKPLICDDGSELDVGDLWDCEN